MARGVRKHEPLELLGICDRRIRAERTDLTKCAKRVYTAVPADPQTIGQHIHRRRVDEGLTQKQLAARWSIWRATLGSWEADHYEPEGRKRAKVVAWLGFDPRDEPQPLRQA